jgi:uncharacterized protein (TIGR02118 family)
MGELSVPVCSREDHMLLVSVMYPSKPGSSFDRDYYLQKHMPLVKERWGPMGLENVQVVRGIDIADGRPQPYQVMALLTFRSMADFQAAADAHGQELFGDIPNFSNVQPVVQISETMG